VISTYRIPLPPPVTDPSSPEFTAAAENYVRNVRNTYDRRANGHRRYYRASGILVVVAGASLPLLTTLSYSNKSLAISLVGVFVSAATALRAFYRWDQMWALLRVAEFSVSKAYWEWRGVIEQHADPGDAAAREATILLLKNIADIRQNEAISFFRELPVPQKQ
jgi:hypothetical protein